jgi:hypothetical protein
LWTADLSHGAKALLGWLHSHDSSYLSTLGVNRVEREFGGGGQCRVWLRELTDAGYLATAKTDGRYTITLLSDPWQKLHKRDGNRRDGNSRDGNRRAAATETDAEARRKPTRIEEQVEEQREHQSSSSASPTDVAADEGFEGFWMLYPKKTNGKGEARKHWRKMKRAEKREAMFAIQRHIGWWKEHETDPTFIPCGNVWLNQRRWEDTEPRSAVPLKAVAGSTMMERVRAKLQTETQT